MLSKSSLPAMARPAIAPVIPLTEAIETRTAFKVETHGNGSVIYRPGDPADRVYLLRAGRVRLLRPSATPGGVATESLHALLHPGDLFGELLRNLLENAIAYAGPGAEVTVSVRETADAVLLTVEDNGPGIPPERRNLVRAPRTRPTEVRSDCYSRPHSCPLRRPSRRPLLRGHPQSPPRTG